MLRYMINRVFLIFIIVFLIMTLVFLAMRVLPGDIASAVLGPDAPAEAYAKVRAELGLDQPLCAQYLTFLAGYTVGDFGKSLQNGVPVIQLIKRALPYTVDLTAASLLIGVVLGIPLGLIAAVRRNGIFDMLSRFAALVGISMPSFFLGILLLYFLGYKLRLFPLIGGGDLGSIGERLHYLVLPALSLGLILASALLRMTRSCLLEVLGEEYIRTAQAKGLGSSAVIGRHAFRNALIPVITVMGSYTGRLLGGTVLVETVFTRPGMGKLLVDGMIARDYPVVQGTIILFALGVVVTNLAVDLLYILVNPRIKYN